MLSKFVFCSKEVIFLDLFRRPKIEHCFTFKVAIIAAFCFKEQISCPIQGQELY